MRKAVILSLFLTSGTVFAERLADYVDTRVGTTFATTLTAGKFGKGSEEHGQTVPAAGVPHGMTLWTPQTRDTEKKCIAPYYYDDNALQGFRNSHWISGGCTQDYGSMTLQPLSGRLRLSPLSRRTPMDKSTEKAAPDYYSVQLPEENIKAEMTGLSRSGIFRFTYGCDGVGHLVINPNSDEGEGVIEIDTLKKEIRGINPIHRIYQGWGQPAGHAGYFIVKLPDDMNIVDFGTYEDDKPESKACRIEKKPGIGAYISFEVMKNVPIEVKVGSSFVSPEGAVRNLAEEIGDKDFDKVRAISSSRWEERLGRIRVEGGKENDKRKFYGSLYRCSLLPREISDVDGSYPSFAGGKDILKSERPYYDDFSMWDTYRALHPLLTLIEPEMSGDMMQSLVLKGEQGGWMPIFPCWNSYTAAMIGDHCAVAIADAAVKGVGNFDRDKAYRLLRRNAFEWPATYKEYADGMGRRALRSYLHYGYIPVEDGVKEAFHKNEQTSRTLEYAFDDYALSQLAYIAGAPEDDVKELLRRSTSWKNVYDAKLGYVNGRHADGRFAEGTDPFTFARFITEGAPCHYTWYVPHDPVGLIEAMGGAEAFEAKLDSLFDEGRYWHGNEPCHQIAYLYDAIGRRDKAARRVRHIMDTEYADMPGGLSGNDDAGQMSAWFVFSAMGFYPVAPSKPEYWLGEPLFSRIVISPKGGKETVILKEGKGEPSIDGYPLDPMRLRHEALPGAVIRF